MSYATKFVHAEPTAKISISEKATLQVNATQTIAKKDATTKIILFVAIVSCIVLAVNI